MYEHYSKYYTQNNRWMLPFSSILTDKSSKVQLRPYTTAKFMLKSFKIRTFADQRHHQGYEKNIPRKAYIQMKSKSV